MSTRFSKEELFAVYQSDLMTVDDIATKFGCTVANVRKWIKLWKIGRGRVLQATGVISAWNKGLTKDTDETMARIAESRRGNGNPMHGRVAWNSGLTKDTDARVLAVSDKAIGRVPGLDTRKKMSDAKLGITGESTNRWTGGLWKSHKYTQGSWGGKRGYVHRMIAEELLCRHLEPGEQVHHIDRNHLNDNPRNLMAIFSSYHTLLHRAMERGECSTKEEQILWLASRGMTFEVVL